MKNLIIYLLPIFLFVPFVGFTQSNEIIIGVESDSVYINDFEDIELEGPFNGWDSRYIDIDNDGMADLVFLAHCWWGGWIFEATIGIYSYDSSTTIVTDTIAIQWVGPCDNTFPDTTSMVNKYSYGDTLSIQEYYSTSSTITNASSSNDPCVIFTGLIDWVGGEHYIGFKKIINNNTYLGWIKVEVTGLFEITIKEIAVNAYFAPRPYPVINELMAWNNTTIADEHGEYDSWIELYNPNTDSVWLGDLFLTNKIDDPSKWRMPDIYMKPGEFLLFWADWHPSQGEFHTNFALSYAEGSVISIFDENKMVVHKHYYGQQSSDISEGSFPDGGSEPWVSFNYPSPGEGNGVVGDLKINEFMASNEETIADEYGEYDDWIELYNAGEDSVFLGSMNLTDNLWDPTKWNLPDVYIKAGEFLLFWADNQPEQGAFHTNFKLDDDGEEIGLFPNSVYETMDSLTFYEQTTDISEGRLPNGFDNWSFFSTPTPGASNEATYVNQNVGSNQLIAFPNPITGGKIFLSKEVTCKVLNSNGQVLFKRTDVNSIDISEYPKGLYIIISNEGEKIKIIKLHD